MAGTERLAFGGLRVRTTVLAGETPGGKFLSGEEFLIGAVTVPKLEFNLPWPAGSQPVAIRLWLGQAGVGGRMGLARRGVSLGRNLQGSRPGPGTSSALVWLCDPEPQVTHRQNIRLVPAGF